MMGLSILGFPQQPSTIPSLVLWLLLIDAPSRQFLIQGGIIFLQANVWQLIGYSLLFLIRRFGLSHPVHLYTCLILTVLIHIVIFIHYIPSSRGVHKGSPQSTGKISRCVCIFRRRAGRGKFSKCWWPGRDSNPRPRRGQALVVPNHLSESQLGYQVHVLPHNHPACRYIISYLNLKAERVDIEIGFHALLVT
jgi:hypothetical protein